MDHSKKASKCYQYEGKNQRLARVNSDAHMKLVVIGVGVPTFNIGLVMFGCSK